MYNRQIMINQWAALSPDANPIFHAVIRSVNKENWVAVVTVHWSIVFSFFKYVRDITGINMKWHALVLGISTKTETCVLCILKKRKNTICNHGRIYIWVLYPSKEKYSLQSMKQTENVYIVWHFHINTCQRYRRN